MTNTASRGERAALAGSNTSTTFHAQASAQLALESTGRFAAQERAAKPTFAGEEPFVRYPAGASWTSDAQPLEAPLGIDVNAMEACGEPFEIAASLSAIEKATAVTAPSSAAVLGEGAPAVVPPSSSPPSRAVATPTSPGAVAQDGGEVLAEAPAQPLSAPPSSTTAAARLAELLPQITIRRLR
jgi:hypothetical protein